MTRARSLTALVAVTAVSGLLLTGCGGDDSAEPPQSVVVTDLGGETPAPNGVVIPDSTPTSTPSPSAPTRTPTAKPTKTPGAEPTKEPKGPITKGELISRVGAAVGAVDSVRVTIGDDERPEALVVDLAYQAAALSLTLTPATPGDPTLQIRRINGQLYVNVDDGQGWARVSPDDPRLAANGSGILSKVLAFDLLTDLRATFVDGADFSVVGKGDLGGTTVGLYALSLDVASLIAPSLILQDDTVGVVDVAVAIGSDDLPVRMDFGSTPATTSTLRFSGWGEAISIAVPPLG